MTSGGSSPMRFSGISADFEQAGFDPHFTAEISNKMRVPKNIRIGGEGGSDNEDVNINWNRGNGYGYPEKFDMQVPDRIMVRGLDQHVGSRALPRELQLDAGNAAMLPDPEMIRILTPPRTITLLDQPVSDYQNAKKNMEAEDDSTLIVYNNASRFPPNMPNGNVSMVVGGADGRRDSALEASAFFDADIQSELDHFRHQFKRLNNRLTVCENEVRERREREGYMLLAGGIYFALQVFRWLFRSNPQ